MLIFLSLFISAITDNILHSIQNSKRTILVVTSNFVKIGYTDFECERAIHEVHTGKHKIITLILDDIKILKPQISKALQFIIECFTYSTRKLSLYNLTDR